MDGCIVKIVRLFLRMVHISDSEEKVEALVQFIKFGIVGVSNTVIGYLVNIVTIFALRNTDVFWDYFAGNILAFIIGVSWSFYWNNRYVFKLKDGETRNFMAALFKTYMSYGFTGIILNNILSYIWIDMLGISKVVAPLINMIIGVPINFIINKLWAFRSQR